MTKGYRVPESPRKRTRVACDDCKIRRSKCSGDSPCSACWEKLAHCQYSVPEKKQRNLSTMAEHPFTRRNAPASASTSTHRPSLDQDLALGLQFERPSRLVMLPDKHVFPMHTKMILLACGSEDASFLAFLDHEIANGDLSYPCGKSIFVVPEGFDYSNNTVDPAVLLHSSLYEKQQKMLQHIKHFSKLLVKTNDQQQGTRIPDIGVPGESNLQIDQELISRGAACLASAIRTVWRVNRANQQSISAQPDHIVLYFLFSATLVILCHEYVGVFDTQKSLHAAHLSMRMLASWSHIDPKFRYASQIITMFYEVVDITNQLNCPHHWKMAQELLNISPLQDANAAALVNESSSVPWAGGTESVVANSNVTADNTLSTNDVLWTSATTTPSATSSSSASDIGTISSDLSMPGHELEFPGMIYSHSLDPYLAMPSVDGLDCDCNPPSPSSCFQPFI